MLSLRAHWERFIAMCAARSAKTHLCSFFCAAIFVRHNAHWLI
jgi:hypothetical protein